MNNIFLDLFNICIVVHLDNILIYSDNISQYKDHIKEVLCQLQKARLYTKTEKYKFHSDSIEYLRYILSSSMFSDKNKMI